VSDRIGRRAENARGCASEGELDTGAGEKVWGIVLAAGKGERLKAEAPKPAVVVGGRPMVARVVVALRGAGVTHIAAVVGHQADHVRQAIGNEDGENVVYVPQGELLGTGHATRQAESAIGDYHGPVVVAYSDLPLLTTRDVAALLRRHRDTDAACTLLTSIFEEPGTLGRILRNGDGTVLGIVEARDATEEQLKVKEINVGVYCFRAPLLFEVLREVTNDNAQRQYYLTDAIEILVRRGERVEAVPTKRPHTGIGVNTREDLERARTLSEGQ